MAFLSSLICTPINCDISASWIPIHMVGINLSWLATRWLWGFADGVKIPVKATFQTADGLGNLGIYIMFIGWFLPAPFALITLSFRLLEKCWNDPPDRIVRLMRFPQTFFHFIWIRLPFDVLPGWIIDEFIRTRELLVATASVVAILNTTTVRRIRKNVVWILGCLVGSVMCAGVTLLPLDALWASEDMFLPLKFFVILFLVLSVLFTLGLSVAFLTMAAVFLLAVG